MKFKSLEQTGAGKLGIFNTNAVTIYCMSLVSDTKMTLILTPCFDEYKQVFLQNIFFY